MDDLDSSNFDADTKGFSLIDVSVSDDDFLFSSSSTSEVNAVDNQREVFVDEAHADKPSESLAAQIPKKHGKCNIRKSLAWDSAFFTSAGVLDAEELSSIMEGAEPGLNSNNQLPGIQEDVSKSTDSITTFESDSLTLESIEADLFSDIRASIQRSSKTSDSRNKNREGEYGNGSSKKIGQPSPGNMVKPKLATRKLVPAAQGPVRMLKPTTSITKQVTKLVARGRELNSTLPRLPVSTTKANLEVTAASKRMSVGTSRAKLETSNAGNIKGAGKETIISKGPRQVDSRNTLQKSMAPSKLSSASSVFNKTAIRSSQTSYDSSSSSSTAAAATKYRSQNDLRPASSTSSSENIRKSQPDVVRRKIDKNVNLPPGSKIRTPSRLPVKSKSRPVESQLSRLSAYVNSTSEHSPSISPASSVSEWSMESSSSTATVNKKHTGLIHGSTPEVSAESNLSQNVQKQLNNTSLDRHDPLVTSMMSQSPKQPSRGAAVSLARPGSAKPSGLRLPSPKIGFFDGAKAGTKTPSDSAKSRSALPSNLPRSASGNHSPSGPSIKAKPGSDSVKVSTTATKTSKFDPRKNQSSPKLTKQLQDRSMGLPSDDVSDAYSEGSKTTMNYSTLESNSIVAQAVDEEKHVVNLLKDSGSIFVNGSDPSFGLPKSTSSSSALENNTSLPEEVGSKQLGCISAEFASDNQVDLHTSQASLNLTKQLNVNSVVLSGGNDSDTLPCSALEQNSGVSKEADGEKHVTDSASELKTHSTGQEDSVSVTVYGDSDSCIELPKSTSVKPALEQISEVSEDSGEGKCFDEASIFANDHSEIVMKTSNVLALDDERETNSEQLRCPSPEIGRHTKVAELIDGKEQPYDCSAFNDNLMVSDMGTNEERNIPVAEAVEEEKHVADSASELKTHLTGQKDSDSVTVDDDSDSCTELPKSTSVKLALEQISEVSEDTGKGKHFDEASIVANDHSEVVLKTSNVLTLDAEPETNSEQLRITSPEIGRHTKVAELIDGREQPYDCSAFIDNLTVSEKKTSEERNILVAEAVEEGKHVDSGSDTMNHFTGSRKDLIFSDRCDNSIELAKLTSTNLPVEKNIQVSDGGQHFDEASLITKDHLEAVPKMSSSPNVDDTTIAVPLRCSSPDIGRDTIGAEVKDRGEHPDDCGLTNNDNLIVFKREANEERNSTVVTGSDGIDGTGLQKDPAFMDVNDGSDASVELPKYSSTNSALNRNAQVSGEGNEGKHYAEVSFIVEDHSELKTSIVPTFDDKTDFNSEPLKCSPSEIEIDPEVADATNFEPLRCSSPEIGRNTIVAEVKDREEPPNDCSFANKDDLVTFKREVSEERNSTVVTGSDAEDHSTGLQKDPVFMDVNDDSDTSVEHPKSSKNSALKQNPQVSEEGNEGKHLAEVSFVAEDYSEVVLKTSLVPNVDDVSGIDSEPLNCSSSEIGRDTEVAEVKDVGEHPDDCGSTCTDNLSVFKKEASDERSSTDASDSGTDAVNHSTVLRKDQIFIDASNTSIDLPKSTVTNSVSETNTEACEEADVAADEGKHSSDSGSDAENRSTVLQSDQIAIDVSNTSIDLPKSTVTNSILETNAEVHQEADVAADTGKHASDSGSDAVNHSTSLQKDQIFADGSDISITNSILERNTEVSDETEIYP